MSLSLKQLHLTADTMKPKGSHKPSEMGENDLNTIGMEWLELTALERFNFYAAKKQRQRRTCNNLNVANSIQQKKKKNHNSCGEKASLNMLTLQKLKMYQNVNENATLIKLKTLVSWNLHEELALTVMMFGAVPRFQTLSFYIHYSKVPLLWFYFGVFFVFF